VKVTRTIAAGVFLGWMCPNSLASQPPGIERPTPPPCCADGQCLSSPLSFGYYDTRWRRWPLETVAQAPTGKPAAVPVPMRQDVSPFVTPPAEQEDRKAPPPSVPAGEQTPIGVPSGAPRAPGAPGGSTSPRGTQPPTSGPGLPTPPQPSPTNPPAGTGTQPGTAPIFKNVSPDSPLNRTGPMGDADPPPSLPFGPALAAPQQPIREMSQQPATMPVQSPSAKPVRAPSNDPPPALPVALVSYEQ
jgi:hypothetical protein